MQAFRKETAARSYKRAVWCYIPHNDLESKFQQLHSSDLDKNDPSLPELKERVPTGMCSMHLQFLL